MIRALIIIFPNWQPLVESSISSSPLLVYLGRYHSYAQSVFCVSWYHFNSDSSCNDQSFLQYSIPQVNHLSHFLVTLELLPILLESASQTGDSRIVIVSSSLYTLSSWEPENLNGEQEYNRLKFYPKSKLYNVSSGYNYVFTELFGQYENECEC